MRKALDITNHLFHAADRNLGKDGARMDSTRPDLIQANRLRMHNNTW